MEGMWRDDQQRGFFMKTKRMWLLGAAVLLNGAALLTSPAALAETDDSARGWPKYSFDYANTNNNPFERRISPETAPRLRRAWQTLNDSQWRPGQPPTGFVLETAVGLR